VVNAKGAGAFLAAVVPDFVVVCDFGAVVEVPDDAGGFVDGVEDCWAKATPHNSVPARDNVRTRYFVWHIF